MSKCDDKMAKDMETVSNMLQEAKKHGLEVEVTLWFGDNMKKGYDLSVSANLALLQWDI